MIHKKNNTRTTDKFVRHPQTGDLLHVYLNLKGITIHNITTNQTNQIKEKLMFCDFEYTSDHKIMFALSLRGYVQAFETETYKEIPELKIENIGATRSFRLFKDEYLAVFCKSSNFTIYRFDRANQRYLQTIEYQGLAHWDPEIELELVLDGTCT